ncbi:MAG: FMN reductase [Cyclobacteriaceae bacterium]|nr:MAG: FMN reductase [Cyclobacteriaceae bacterium]
MKRILVFAGSSSRNSINKKLARFAASQLEDTDNRIIDLNDFEMPLFSVDREIDSGIPEEARKFKSEIEQADGIIMSLAEHNGSYSTAYKNVYDWVSRIKGNMWEDKPILLMATSPGARGGKSVLQAAKSRLPFQGGNVVASFSLPLFKDNFDGDHGITDEQLNSEFEGQLSQFVQAVE